MKTCPFRMAAAVQASFEYSIECVGEDCALWDRSYGGCSLSASSAYRHILDARLVEILRAIEEPTK